MTTWLHRAILVTIATMLVELIVNTAAADKIKVAGIYTVPVQQKWVGTLHRALVAAQQVGEIDYTYAEKVPNTDYIRVLREYSESGVQLIVGEAFGISREARKVADDYPKVAYLMGDPASPTAKTLPCLTTGFTSPAISWV